MNKQKALIVDTNYAVIPLIDFLKQNGYEIGIIGKFCSKFIRGKVDAFHKVNYSRLGKLEDVIKEYGYEHVIPGCTDLSYLQCSILERGKVDDAKIIKALHEKKSFKEVLTILEIPTAQSYSEKSVMRQKHQLIIKPVDSFSGIGVSIVPRNVDKITKAIAIEHARTHSLIREVIAEEYFPGDLYSASSLWNGEEIVKEIYVREYGIANEFRVDYSYIDQDFFNTDMAGKIRNDLFKIAKYMKLKPGILHVQFIKNDRDYVIIECMRRLPGDLYARLIEIDSDWHYGKDYVQSFIGNEIGIIPEKITIKAERHVRLTVSQIEHRRKLISKLRHKKLNYSEYRNQRKAPFFRSTFFVEDENSEELIELFRNSVNHKNQ